MKGVLPRFLVAESETLEQREQRRAQVGCSSGEAYVNTLRSLAPDAVCDLVRPSEEGTRVLDRSTLARYDAIFLTGSPLHVYQDTSEVRRQLAFMRAVFASQTPCFGSCAGLQVAVVAAGGVVRENRRGREVAFARRIVATEAGRTHPLLAGRPTVWDAPAIHTDEVERLPPEAVLLACNGLTMVQAAEIRHAGGVFWGVQYHPELSLREVAAALCRQADDLVMEGLARDVDAVKDHARRIEALGQEPARRDLAWQLGLDEQVTNPSLRQIELRNFIEFLVVPTMAARGRLPVSGKQAGYHRSAKLLLALKKFQPEHLPSAGRREARLH
ncbi:gamma-glutamyl-gamma-aminobutyrate hydrolase family protein [Belnapia sp. T18]|uniref:Gamma-glutamyl-gamma-aminobutyrate hydrolase family protein n=1 Tax=Belnapia arida TaxID=2804533 RepID=A0ABS1UBS3_9PROT|nr:gamma-glutamyl-gamma-aminobutyrate hydrolase family protein [Belnapia arida]MBL6082133.1 gamma-glutamyl-gamma-aminobutyrate hydrolase family protein [Belnapia arida]